MSIGIYIFQFQNGKKYVGQSYFVEKRIKQHVNNAKNGLDECPKFYSALRKYNYQVEIRKIVLPESDFYTKENLDLLEQYIIIMYDSIENGYNLKEGGSCGKHSEETKEKIREKAIGRKHTENTKIKISEVQKGKQLSEQHKEKIRQSHSGEKNHFYGKHHTEEVKQKIREKNSGKKHSEETKEKLSQLSKGRRHTEETKNKMSEAQKGRKHSEETKEKLSKIFTGENSPNYGKNHSQETKDKISKAKKGKKNKKQSGELNPMAKLTWEKVREIRKIYEEGNTSQRTLAKIFEVSQITIFDVIKQNLWKE